MSSAGSVGAALRLAPTVLIVLGVWALAWREQGSFAPADWLGYAVFGALLCSVIFLSGAAVRPPLALTGAVACLLALAVWDAASISWSPLPAGARNEALLAAFYGVVLLLPALTLRSGTERRLAVATVVFGLGALTVAAGVALAFGAHPEEEYSGGRLYFPVSYVNAQAAVFLAGFWPAVALAARRRSTLLERTPALAAAAAFLAGWLLTQSKGGLVGLVVSAVVVFSVAQDRLRLVLPTAIAGAIAAAAYEPLTGPYRAAAAEQRDAVHTAGRTMLLCALTGLAVAFLYVLVDHHVTVGRRTRRLAAVSLAALVVAGAGGGTAAFFATVDRPGAWIEQKWRSFKRLPSTKTGSSHLTNLGSNRYDFWRVDLREFADHPLAGVGARAFGPVYLERRRSDETPQRGHSLELDTLAETGVVGFLLLLGALGFALVAAAQGARSLLGAALLGTGVYWVAHSAVDWIWTLPAAGMPFFLLLGVAAVGNTARPILRARVSVAAGVAALVLGMLAFAPPWLATRYTAQALAGSGNPADDLRRARWLDPLSVQPLLAEAALARSPGDILPLERAVAKEPRRSELHYLLGRAYLKAGRKRAARHELLEAKRLDPRDELVRAALEQAG